MNGLFNKKGRTNNVSRKEIIDSVKISIEKNNKAMVTINQYITDLDKEEDFCKDDVIMISVSGSHLEDFKYIKVVLEQVNKMYHDTLKKMGVYHGKCK